MVLTDLIASKQVKIKAKLLDTASLWPPETPHESIESTVIYRIEIN